MKAQENHVDYIENAECQFGRTDKDFNLCMENFKGSFKIQSENSKIQFLISNISWSMQSNFVQNLKWDFPQSKYY